MKTLIISLLLYFFDFCSNPNPINRIEIKKVDFEISSIFKINCNNFESYFSDDIKSIIISNNDSIKLINNLITKLKIDSSNYLPDVRAKIFFISNDKLDSACLSYSSIFYDGKSYLPDRKLIKLIEDIK